MASCGSLEDELRQYSQEDEVTMADSVETLGVDLRKKESRRKEQARRKKMYKAFQKNFMKVGGEMLLRAGMVPARIVASSCSENCSNGKIEIEETGGSSSGQKEYDFVVLFHGGFWSSGGGRSSLLWPRSKGQKESG